MYDVIYVSGILLNSMISEEPKPWLGLISGVNDMLGWSRLRRSVGGGIEGARRAGEVKVTCLLRWITGVTLPTRWVVVGSAREGVC